MSIIKTKLFVGATTPFQVLHLSDTHLTRADLRDGERKVTLAQNRLPHFNYEGTFAGRIPQIVTSCTDARLIEIV